VGVVAAITRSLSGMIRSGSCHYAICLWNCFISALREGANDDEPGFELIEELNLPPGVVSWSRCEGDRRCSARSPAVRAISFVGSSPVAKYVYSRATANGKRAQCQGGAKNR